ncbi:hypothetical protein J2Y69_003062 [Microbacterium resistens]|uniref:Phage tail protein n=1 Tax=Microbacterium resistens TaxID=156977 RepID=A0ABU1SFQ5_9MICO|nr:hypothetical protein [Microbacterium resistens]MDR6868446.1 hypothetical protein [Microbacterium resistens]
MRFQIEDLIFEGGSGPARYTIEPDSISGWLLGGTSMRRERIDRPVGPGWFSGQAYPSGRSISWGGLVHTDGPDDQEFALRTLEALLRDGSTARLHGHGRWNLWTDVVRAGEPSHSILVPGRLARYRLGFEADDPDLYGETHVFQAGEPAAHQGLLPAHPVFTATGNRPDGYTITGPGGRRIVVAAPLLPGQTHEIPTAEGGLYVNGVRVPRGIRVWQPWTIGPSVPGVVQTVTSGVALRVAVTDTYG